jgi:phosphate acetyltransferase
MGLLFEHLPRKIKDTLFQKVENKILLLPEHHDPRVEEAILLLKKELAVQIIKPTPKEIVEGRENTLSVVEKNLKKRGKCLQPSHIDLGADPLFYAGAQLAQKQVDAVVAGCTCPTADVIRAAVNTIGLKENTKIITSCFLFYLKEPTPGGQQLIVFADCGVIPDPSQEELVEIAFLAQESFTHWTNQTPYVSFLSFSTQGSASHPSLEKIRNAHVLFSKQYPHIFVQGEVQFDAACVPAVAARKISDGNIQGQSNVFVFPDLNAANISYKITQYIGKAQAWGPILLGTARPFSDLSRGASALDIAHVSILSLAL